MNGYAKCFDDNKTMSFLADDKELLKKYTKVWKKIRDLIGKKFNSELVYGDKYIKTKIKSYNNDIRTNFHGEGNSRKVPKENCSYKCFSLTLRPRMPHICGFLDCFSSSHVLATS